MTAPKAQGRREFIEAASRMCALSALGLLLGRPAWADDAGLALARKVYDRADGQDASSVVTMALTEEGRSPRERSMVLYRRNGAEGEVSTLIRFTAPADIEGTGLLTLDAADGDSRQSIYLPALQRVRRVDSKRKGGRFVNSDYYFEDLRDRKPAMDVHRIVGRESIDGWRARCWRACRWRRANSVYLRRVSWTRPREPAAACASTSTRNDPAQPAKRLTVSAREQIQGYWTVTDSTMMDLRSGHRTRLKVERIVYDRSLPERLFSSRALEQERMEKEFRP